jgi:carboxynorspermidine decarboxylase
MRYCDHISFNSLSQWERHKKKMQASKKKISAGLRINPEYSEVETDLYNPCLPGTRFGVTHDLLGMSLPDGIEGLHFHTLCQNNSDVLERTFKAVEERFGHLLHQAKWLNMGGGHHITKPYYDRQKLINLIRYIREKYRLKVILEPGEAIAIHTGYLVSTVTDIINSRGINVAILNVSFTAHMPDCLEMPYKPDILGASEPVEGKPTYRMGGTTCLSGDFMGDYSFDKPLQIGDKIIFDDMSHYTMVKTSNFNGVEHPSIGIWQKDDTFRLVKKFGYEMYRDRLS